MLSERFIDNAKEVILTLAESVWASGFALAGRIHSLVPEKRISGWSSSGDERILVIAPHPDDEAAGCAGTLMRHKRAGDTTCVAYVTDGRSSRALGLEAAEMARRRKAEARQAAKFLQIDHLAWFGLPEGAWVTDQFHLLLQTLLEDFAPTIIYAPSRIDFHPEHRRVAHLLAALLPLAGHPPVRIYQVHLPLTSLLTNLVVDVSDHWQEIKTVLAAYETQTFSTLRALRSRHYAARFYGLGRSAEEFWEMPALHYRLLHQTNPDHWDADQFRGLYFYPFTDPLAYLKGGRERRRIANLLNGDYSTRPL